MPVHNECQRRNELLACRGYQFDEMHEPFLQMIRELYENGQEAAREMYGCRGWVLHHNTDLWRMNGAVDKAYCGTWPTCNAWLCHHLWERYLYSGDKDFLASVYPIMKSASEFLWISLSGI